MITLLDTGPLVALLAQRDQYHDWAIDAFYAVPAPLASCDAVLCEAYHLLKEESGGTDALLTYVRRNRDGFNFAFTGAPTRIMDLMLDYNDVPMDYTDACLVAMAEQLPEEDPAVLTTDGDFSIYRMKNGAPLNVISPHLPGSLPDVAT